MTSNLLNTGKALMLLSVMTGMLLAVGFFIGGSGGALVALVFSAILNFASYWYSDKLVLRMYNATELSEDERPEIHTMAERLAKEAGVSKPPLYLVKSATPNAFATGRNPANSAIAVTSGLLEHLDEAEVEGVLAHEMAHIVNRDTLLQTVAATVAGAITWVAHMSIFFGGNRNRSVLGALAMFILAPVAATLVRTAISRTREFAADETGARLSGNPMPLASALQKIESLARQMPMQGSPATSHMFIVNPFSSSMSGLFSTHPPTEARVERLRRLADK